MAEIFGTASSAIGVIGVAGQIAKGCIDLRDIIQDIKDAPATMAEMAKELDMFSDVVQAIEASFANSPESASNMELGATRDEISTLEQTIDHCRERMEKALKHVKRNDPAQHTKKYKRVWSQVRSAFTMTDMDKLVSSLDRSKTMLLQAYSHKIGEKQWTRLEELDASIGSLLVEHKSTRSHTFHELQKTSEKLDNIQNNLSNMQTSHAGGFSKTDLAAGLAAVAAMLDSKIDAGNCTTLQEVRSLRSQIHESGNSIDSRLGELETNQQTVAKVQAVARKARRAPTVPLNSSWTKVSSKSDEYLMKIPLFGSLAVEETTVTYSREKSDYGHYRHPDKKQGVTTKVSFILPSWLSSYGFFIQKGAHVFHTGCKQRFGAPTYGMETINVREKNDEIFRACMDHDLEKIRYLFDDGLASPYDVDEDGRNCLYFLSNYPKEGFNKDGNVAFRSKLEVTSSVIDLLLHMGVDSGVGGQNSENRVPVMEFLNSYCSARFLGSGALEEEQPLNLFKRLWESAKTSPLSGHDVMLHVTLTGEYCSLDFAEALNSSYSAFPKSAALWMISQDEWDIQWHPDQLADVCSPRDSWWSNDMVEIYFGIKDWITAPYQQTFQYLNTKLLVLARFLQTDICKYSRYASVVHALQVCMEQSGFIFNAFTKKLYSDKCEVAWVRHRFRKMVLLRSWLTVVFRLLLAYGRRGTQASPGNFMQFFQFSQDQNFRVSSAFVEAYVAVFLPKSNDEEKEGGVSEAKKKKLHKKNLAHSDTYSSFTPAHSSAGSESEDGWKTDDGEDSDDEEDDDTECSSESDEGRETAMSSFSIHIQGDIGSDNEPEEKVSLHPDQPQQPRCQRAYFFFPRCSSLRRASPYSTCAIRIRHLSKKSKHVRRETRIMHVRRRRPCPVASEKNSSEAKEKKTRVQPSDKYDFDHDWETEDEWESGYMLESAVDVIPLDTTNPQMLDKEHYIGEKDFDCDFWAPIFDQVKVSNGWKIRPFTEWEEAKADALKTLGPAAQDTGA